ncbi:MAG: hypothetical protein IJ220_01325 [Clostridia bacterium]|nr:hypothetical protein [Clostridia bacterium]
MAILKAILIPYGLDCNNNRMIGKIVSKGTDNCNLYNQGNELLVTIGLENITVLHCNNVILVSNNDEIGKTKEIINELSKNNEYKDFL